MPYNLVVIQGTPVNVRAAPTRSAAVQYEAHAGEFGVCMAVKPDSDGEPFFWLGVGLDGHALGWIRADLCFIIGDYSMYQQGRYPTLVNAQAVFTGAYVVRETTAVATDDLWAAPIPTYKITHGFGEHGHKGIDLAAPSGVPIYPRHSGTWMIVNPCTKCTAAQPSNTASSVLQDPGWGYGLGNYLVIRHSWADLPDSLKRHLDGRGLADCFLFVIYGHLSAFAPGANPGDPVAAGTMIGYVGTTGNSTGNHLHLEVRVSPSRIPGFLFDDTKTPLVNPSLLFAL